MAHRLDVLIPAYNASEQLEAALNSVSTQVIPPCHIMVCDDASDDNTAEIAESKDSVNVVRNTQNLGVGATRQILLELADAEWILYLDADDQLTPDAYELFASVVKEYDSAVVHAFAEQPQIAVLDQKRGSYDGPQLVTHRELLRRNPICSSATLIRRDAALAAGGYTAARRLVDYCMWFRIARIYPAGIFLHTQPVVRRLISSTTITGNVNAAVVEEARLLDREWSFSYGRSTVTSAIKKQVRLNALWLRGLSRHSDYGKIGTDYVHPNQLEGFWSISGVLSVFRTTLGMQVYSKLRQAARSLSKNSNPITGALVERRTEI